jgi:hypothetical protein
MQLELGPGRIDPMIGKGGMSRQAAAAEVQSILDRGRELSPGMFTAVAETWRNGAKDDTLLAGPFIWCIYEHPADENPTHAAMAWIDDFSQRMSGAPATWSADRPGHQPGPADGTA